MRKLLLVLCLLFISSNAYAQTIFHGLRPNTAVNPDKKLSVSIPVVPKMGFMDLRSLANVPTFIDAMMNIKMSSDEDPFSQIYGLVDSINGLYGKNVYMRPMVHPSRIVSLNTKYFELTMDGGILNYTVAKANGLSKKMSYSDVEVDEWFMPYLKTDPQNLLSLSSYTALGADVWAIGKLPIRVNNFVLTPMAGVGMTLGYLHKYVATIEIEEEIHTNSGLNDTSYSEHGAIWGIHGMAGFQFDSKFLTTRAVFQACSRVVPSHLSGFSPLEGKPIFNFGLDVKVHKILTFRAEVLNFSDPNYKIEVSRSFLTNSEVALGYIHKLNGDQVLYGMLGLGGELVKADFTILTDGSSVGLMFGLNVGYMP